MNQWRKGAKIKKKKCPTYQPQEFDKAGVIVIILRLSALHHLHIFRIFTSSLLWLFFIFYSPWPGINPGWWRDSPFFKKTTKTQLSTGNCWSFPHHLFFCFLFELEIALKIPRKTKTTDKTRQGIPHPKLWRSVRLVIPLEQYDLNKTSVPRVLRSSLTLSTSSSHLALNKFWTSQGHAVDSYQFI